jgi:hypothetical protein
MQRDLYTRPPGPADAGRITRRGLLRLGPPAVEPDGAGKAAVRAGVAELVRHPGQAALQRAVAPVASSLAELAGDSSATSAFTIALDPEPDRAVAELARSVAPGGMVAIATWVPRGLPGRLFEFAEQIAPLPVGIPSPSEWGRAEIATRRLGRALTDLEVRTRTVRLSFPDPDAAFTAISAGLPFPFARLDELRPAFDRLLSSCNDALDGVEIAGRYLLLRGSVRG